ncbi:mannitol-1-phosphate 5-dehydrogenase [Paenibacillus cisolokensis]|uniref:mannitol-1-phosphate 5-dehydrogenase n=1 Tax=Paenibacillus cisolokensis TaxID=1658519 RepID=UPI003D29FB8B
MKAVHFGAGNIGRGFIGPILSKSGYHVCFVARNKKQISELQTRREYPLVLANEDRKSEIVDNVTALSLGESGKVTAQIAAADIVTTAVGISALKDIAESIARGIRQRIKQGNATPLHIMACENGIGASQLLKKWVSPYLENWGIQDADRFVSYPNTVVDRIVPVQKHKDPLQVMVEPFSEWVIDRNEIKGELPPLQGVRYSDSLDAYLERKLFTVNTGHCCAAYFGYLEGYSTIQDAMSDPGIRSKVTGVLMETGALLRERYGFDEKKHRLYIEKILGRFANPHFHDPITRVARSPIRKLSSSERLVYPAMQAERLGLNTSGLVTAIAAALLFDHADDPEALKLQEQIRKQGIREVVSHVLGIPFSHPLHGRITAAYRKLCLNYPHLASTGFETIFSPTTHRPASTE